MEILEDTIDKKLKKLFPIWKPNHTIIYRGTDEFDHFWTIFCRISLLCFSWYKNIFVHKMTWLTLNLFLELFSECWYGIKVILYQYFDWLNEKWRQKIVKTDPSDAARTAPSDIADTNDLGEDQESQKCPIVAPGAGVCGGRAEPSVGVKKTKNNTWEDNFLNLIFFFIFFNIP